MAAATWQQHEDVIEQLKRIADALEASVAEQVAESAPIHYWPNRVGGVFNPTLTDGTPVVSYNGGTVAADQWVVVNEGFVDAQPVRG